MQQYYSIPVSLSSQKLVIDIIMVHCTLIMNYLLYSW